MGTRGPIFYDLETNGDHLENHKEILNKRSWTDSIQEKIKRQRESKLKMVRCEPQRRRTLYLTATAWELTRNRKGQYEKNRILSLENEECQEF